MSEFKGNQKAVVEHEKGNLLVSASAGSGKTFTMISRAIRLIKEKKARVSNILALTFTEAAALEMKEKLKKALFGLISNGGEEFTEQISELDCADISTLHAFCGRIIREYFFVTGVSPDFKILDADEASEYQRIAIDTLFTRLYEKKEPFFLELLKRFRVSRKDETLKNLVISLYENARVEPNFDEMLSKFEGLYTEQGLDETVETVKDFYNDRVNEILEELSFALSVFKTGERAKAVEVTSKLYEDILDALNGDYYALEKYKDYSLSFMPSPFGTKLTEEEVTAREIVKGAKDKFIALNKRFTKDIKSKEEYLFTLKELKEISTGLKELTKAFLLEYEKIKREENALDFSDLEHYAVKTLEDGEVKAEIIKKYEYIFVDEYQDTNTVQELIISSISNDNLFMVGDDKQSIYGFRGCRPEIFLEKEKDLPLSGGKALRLNHNFRSAKAVINAVNQIFAFSMTKDYYGYSYLQKAMLAFGGTYPDGADGRAELHLLTTSSSKKEKSIESPKVYDLKEECFKLLEDFEDDKDVEEVALLIADIIEQEYKKEYYDVKDGAYKPVTPSDVVILSRSVETTYIARLVSTLYRLGIPVNSKVSVNALDFPETQTLVKFLELLENERQDLPLVTVMKSVIGGFSDEELYDIASLFVTEVKRGEREGAGFYEAYAYARENASDKLKEKLVNFSEYIKEARTLKDFIGAKGVIDKVLEDTGFLETVLTLKEGKAVAQIIENFISKSVSGEKLLTVSEFLDKIYGQEKAFRVETAVSENAVRIMTIHASKGLEFPVVIVCGLEKKSNSTDEEKELLFSKENGFITKFYSTSTMLKEETPFRLLTKEQLRLNRIKEELRLFYVALTRASYSLHMVAKCKEDPRKQLFSGGERYIEYIPKSMPITVRDATEFSFDAIKHEARKILVGKIDEERKEIIKKNLEFIYPYKEDISVPLKTSVTSTLLIKDKSLIDLNETEDESVIARVIDLEDGEVVPTDKTSAERGTLAHKILELYDFEKGDLLLQVKELVEKGVVDEKLVKEINLSKLSASLSGEILSIIKGRKLYRETPFFANFKASEVLDTTSSLSVLIQGVIDLLAVGEEDCVIIDYKYSKLPKEKLIEKYQKQLSLYEMAVSRVLGLKVSKKYLFNILSGEIILL